jgi:hypothetical protein
MQGNRATGGSAAIAAKSRRPHPEAASHRCIREPPNREPLRRSVAPDGTADRKPAIARIDALIPESIAVEQRAPLIAIVTTKTRLALPENCREREDSAFDCRAVYRW